MSLISVLPPPSATSSVVTPPDSSPDSSPTTPVIGQSNTNASPFFSLDYTDMETRLEQLSLCLLQKKRLNYGAQSRRSFYKTHSVPSIMVSNSGGESCSSSINSSQDSSLVSSPTDPTGPVGQGLKASKVKKMVRFADSMGLQLAHVRLLSSAPSLLTNQYNSSDDDENEDLNNMAYDLAWNSTSDSSSYFDSNNSIESYAQALTDQVASCVYQNSLAHRLDDLPEESPSRTLRRVTSTAVSADPNQFVYDNLIFTWHCGFEQPGLAPDFYSQLKDRKVCLESICTDHFILNGFVRVLKLEELLNQSGQLEQKQELKPRVFIRYTLNNWSDYIDYECTHFALSSTSTVSSTDRFKCSIILDKSKFLSSINEYKPGVNEVPCLKLEFAVCYELTANSGTFSSYWDNNHGQNYHYDCYFKII